MLLNNLENRDFSKDELENEIKKTIQTLKFKQNDNINQILNYNRDNYI